MQLSWSVENLKLKEEFGISRGSFSEKKTVIVMLSESGFTGYGEVSPNNYYNVYLDTIVNALIVCKSKVEQLEFCSPENYWVYLKNIVENNYFILSALDMAAYDLMGKIENRSVHSYFSGEKRPVLSSYTIGLSSIEAMVAKVNQTKWPLYKIKLGSTNDLLIVNEIRKVTNARLIVDANCAWTAKETISKSKELLDLNVEFIEQPLSANDTVSVKHLRDKCYLPIIADESCVVEQDVDKCAKYYDGVNIKLAKCGGITPAFRMINSARAKGLKVMIGCMVESSIAISATLPLLKYVDFADVDAPLLISNDLSTGIKYDNGYITSLNGVGLGLNITKDSLLGTLS